MAFCAPGVLIQTRPAAAARDLLAAPPQCEAASAPRLGKRGEPERGPRMRSFVSGADCARGFCASRRAPGARLGASPRRAPSRPPRQPLFLCRRAPPSSGSAAGERPGASIGLRAACQTGSQASVRLQPPDVIHEQRMALPGSAFPRQRGTCCGSRAPCGASLVGSSAPRGG